jgi:hypothetical protein
MGELLTEANPPLEAPSKRATLPPPDLVETLLAPLRCVWRPGAACQALFRAAPPAYWLTYGGYVLALAAGVALLAMWGATIQVVYVSASSGAASGTQGLNLGVYADATVEKTAEDGSVVTQSITPGWQIQRRTPAHVWRDWHAEGWFGPAEAIFLATVLAVLVGTALLAWLQLPFVHRSGSVRRSLALAWRAVAAGGGALMIGTLASGVVIVAQSHLNSLGLLPGILYSSEALTALSFCGPPIISIWFILGVVAAAADRAPAAAPPAPPPRCESCGYDLTHRALNEVCPECGQSVARSLVPGMRRWPADWERQPSIETWLRSSLRVLCAPRGLYERLTLRSSRLAGMEQRTTTSEKPVGPAQETPSLALGVPMPTSDAEVGRYAPGSRPDGPGLRPSCGMGFQPSCAIGFQPVAGDDGRVRVRWFSRLHVMLIGGGAFCWMILMFSWFGYGMGATDSVCVAVIVGLVVPLIGWVLHRTIAAVVATWWMVRGSLPDGRWAAKVILYETPFLWLFCAVWGTLITSYISADDWVSRAIEPVVDSRSFTWAFGMPPELALPLGLSGSLIVLWLFRYQRAGQAIRWSNF